VPAAAGRAGGLKAAPAGDTMALAGDRNMILSLRDP